MKTVLIVVQDFAEYKRGTRIEDPVIVDQIRKSSNSNKVVATQVKDDSRFSAVVH